MRLGTGEALSPSGIVEAVVRVLKPFHNPGPKVGEREKQREPVQPKAHSDFPGVPKNLSDRRVHCGCQESDPRYWVNGNEFRLTRAGSREGITTLKTPPQQDIRAREATGAH